MYPRLENLYLYKANDKRTRIVWNTLKANNKYTRMTLRRRLGVLLIWADFTPFSNDSIVNFKLVNIYLEFSPKQKNGEQKS